VFDCATARWKDLPTPTKASLHALCVVDANVVWATGFRLDHEWIHLPITGPDGWPRQTRGVVTDVPGLFVIGLPFMYAGASALLGGVGRDAAYLVKQMALQAADLMSPTGQETAVVAN